MAVRSFTKFTLPAFAVRKFSNEAKLVSVTTDDKTGIATLGLQRPPVNSLNLDLLTQINSALKDVEKNKCRGLILTSKKDGVFSAGLDITEMYKPETERFKKFWTTLQDTWITLYSSPYPTVAVINGHAPAGGCLLSLCCEYRVMSKTFSIGLNETLLGIIAPPWFISSMRNVIGQRQTELALTTGNMFTTDEALNIRLIDQIVSSKEEGIESAESFLKRFSIIPAKSRYLTKMSVRGQTIEDMVKDRQNDLNRVLEFVFTPEVQKNLGFYLEKLSKKTSN